MQLALLIAVVFLMHVARSFSPESGLGTGPAATTLGAGFLLLGALFAGNLFSSVRLPRLTGYLTLGMLGGPHGFGLISEQMLVDLRIFNGVAIALIALTAGTEMDLRAMRPLLRGVAWISAIAIPGAMVVLAGTAFLAANVLFPPELSVIQLVAIAAVVGVALAAQSPAVVIALRKEMEADGPLVRTVLGVVVLSDLLVIIAFGVFSWLARSALGSNLEAITLGSLAWEVLGSIGVGLFIGALVAAFLWSSPSGGPLFVVMAGFLVAEVGNRVHLDPLLLALSAGVFIRNLTRQGDRLHSDIEAASLPVYILFFAVAGATVHLNAVFSVGPLAVVFVLVRAACLLGGGWLAATVAGSAPVVRRYVGFGLLPQAGLALGLTLLFSRAFPSVGASVSSLIFAVVAINELISPVLYRWALSRSGEAAAGALARQPHSYEPVDFAHERGQKPS